MYKGLQMSKHVWLCVRVCVWVCVDEHVCGMCVSVRMVTWLCVQECGESRRGVCGSPNLGVCVAETWAFPTRLHLHLLSSTLSCWSCWGPGHCKGGSNTHTWSLRPD